ncbi:hypothetical protein KJ359_001733 [Pestalotiopsis sp. 9143b]|nr:hypothetical protein KJ359_001733 [Pestalotiopsis sp. 9143b]
MESLTSGITVIPKPDFFDGAQASAVCPNVRNELSTLIMPTKHAGVPTVPNFFLEAKTPGGGANVAVRQAGTDGAYGARAMHALQNYGKDEPEYDGNAYAFSSTYHAGTGTLAIHAHHVTAPLAGEERPEYHMNQMKAYAVTSDLESIANGAGAFRNTRDMAQGYRDQFTEEANARARARGLPLVPLPEEVTIEAHADDASSHDEFVNCEEPAEYGSQPLQYLSTTYTTEPAVNAPQPLAQYLIEDEPLDSSQEPLADDEDPSLSFTTSLTSSVSTEPSRSKRSRQASNDFSVLFSLSEVPETQHFVARQQELAVMRRALSSDGSCRIVSLHGLGGIGKTQLATDYDQEPRWAP